MDRRHELQGCLACGADGVAELLVSAVQLGTEVRRGTNRIIQDERQVTSEYGARWRDMGTTGREGGAGRKMIFHG